MKSCAHRQSWPESLSVLPSLQCSRPSSAWSELAVLFTWRESRVSARCLCSGYVASGQTQEQRCHLCPFLSLCILMERLLTPTWPDSCATLLWEKGGTKADTLWCWIDITVACGRRASFSIFQGKFSCQHRWECQQLPSAALLCEDVAGYVLYHTATERALSLLSSTLLLHHSLTE